MEYPISCTDQTGNAAATPARRQPSLDKEEALFRYFLCRRNARLVHSPCRKKLFLTLMKASLGSFQLVIYWHFCHSYSIPRRQRRSNFLRECHHDEEPLARTPRGPLGSQRFGAVSRNATVMVELARGGFLFLQIPIERGHILGRSTYPKVSIKILQLFMTGRFTLGFWLSALRIIDIHVLYSYSGLPTALPSPSKLSYRQSIDLRSIGPADRLASFLSYMLVWDGYGFGMPSFRWRHGIVRQLRQGRAYEDTSGQRYIEAW